MGGESRPVEPWTRVAGGGWRLCEAIAKAGRDLARNLLRAPVSLERLSFDPVSDRVTYARRPGRYDHEPAAAECLADPKELLARVLLHIPEPRRHVIRYYGAYSSVVRARRRREERATAALGMTEAHEEYVADLVADHDRRALRRRWAQLIRRIYEIDPLMCTRCGGPMRIIAFITSRGSGWVVRRGLQRYGPKPRGKVGGCVMQSATRDRCSRTQPKVIGKILNHLARRGVDARSPPSHSESRPTAA